MFLDQQLRNAGLNDSPSARFVDLLPASVVQAIPASPAQSFEAPQAMIPPAAANAAGSILALIDALCLRSFAVLAKQHLLHG
jgi:hypothetical protein